MALLVFISAVLSLLHRSAQEFMFQWGKSTRPLSKVRGSTATQWPTRTASSCIDDCLWLHSAFSSKPALIKFFSRPWQAIYPCTDSSISIYTAPTWHHWPLPSSAFQGAFPSFYCYNGIFTSSFMPLSGVTMTALIAFAEDYTVPPSDKSKEKPNSIWVWRAEKSKFSDSLPLRQAF